MELDKLKAQYREKINSAKAKQAEWKGKEDEMPKEVSDSIDAILGEADVIMAKISIAEKIAAGETYLSQSAGTPAAAAGPTTVDLNWRQSGPSEGMSAIDAQSWREIVVKIWEVEPQLGIIVQGERKYRYHIPEAVQAKGYESAYEAYLRKGFNDLGPQDRKTLTEGVDSAGGFLVPEDWQNQIIRKIATTATLRPNARVVQTSRDIAKWPKVHYTTDDKYTSGVRMTWVGGEIPANATIHRVTDPVFGLYAIPVHTAMASMPLSNDLLEDAAFDVQSIATDMLAEAFALGENDAGWNGNGVAKPKGVLDGIDADGPAKVVSGDANTLTADGVINLAYALPAQYERNAKFYFAKATEAVIRKLKATTNEYLWPVTMQGGPLGNVSPRELMGYPTVRDEFLPAVGTNNYPIVFGDMSAYLLLDRVGLAIQRLSELYAETNITLLLAKKRVGGQVVEPWRLKVQKCST